MARCVRREGRTWVELWTRSRDGKPGGGLVQQSARGSASWSTVRHRAKPRARLAARLAVAARDRRGVSRYVLHRRGAEYRIAWQERGVDGVLTGPQVRLEGCSRAR